MIDKAITNAIKEQWPHLKTKTKTKYQWYNVNCQEFLIEIHQTLKPKTTRETKQDINFWIATIHIKDEQIKLSITPNKYCYENILSNPTSLDELYTILATHIEDTQSLIPTEWHEPQRPNEPSELELKAHKHRAAATLPHKLKLRKWGQ